MTFKFTCPQGHELEAELAHEGRSCHCPQCGSKMVVPPAPVTRAPQIVVAGQEESHRTARWNVGKQPIVASPFVEDPTPDQFHIPCPKGHVLETTEEMLGKLAMCPRCQSKFKLDRTSSLEFQSAEQKRLEQQAAKLARRWMNGTIVATVLTLLGVAILFALLFAN